MRSGEVVFLVGGNGSGKTTLAKLLVGLYRPESGAVILDGKALSTADLAHYREQFAAVFADFFLFDRLLGIGGAPAGEFATTLLNDLQLSHRQGRVLVVSHDDRYFHAADRVIKLENGQILSLHTAARASPSQLRVAP